mgnify:CR=1 FL=1
MTRDERLQRITALNAATDFVQEQTAIEGAPGIDLRYDLPMDRQRVYSLWPHDMGSDDAADYRHIAVALKLPWERGARRFYAPFSQADAVAAALEAEGFIIAREL